MAEQGPSLSQVRITTVTLTSLWWCKSFAQSFCADSLPAAGQLIVVNFFHVLFVSSCWYYSPFKQSHPPLPEKKNYIWFVNRHYNNRELKQQRTTLETRKLQICLSNNFKQFYTLFSCVFWCLHFTTVLVRRTALNDLFYKRVDDLSTYWKIFNLLSLSRSRSCQFDSRIVAAHFASQTTRDNREMIIETRSLIFRWCFRCGWSRPRLRSWICLAGLTQWRFHSPSINVAWGMFFKSPETFRAYFGC